MPIYPPQLNDNVWTGYVDKLRGKIEETVRAIGMARDQRRRGLVYLDDPLLRPCHIILVNEE